MFYKIHILICDTLSIKQIKNQLLNYINKINILHSYVQNYFLVKLLVLSPEFSTKYVFSLDKVKQNILSSPSSLKQNPFLKHFTLSCLYLRSDWYALSLLSIAHQLWHSCLEENRFPLPPQPPYTNGLHSPERRWKNHSRTNSEQVPSDIGSRQRSIAEAVREVNVVSVFEEYRDIHFLLNSVFHIHHKGWR